MARRLLVLVERSNRSGILVTIEFPGKHHFFAKANSVAEKLPHTIAATQGDTTLPVFDFEQIPTTGPLDMYEMGRT